MPITGRASQDTLARRYGARTCAGEEAEEGGRRQPWAEGFVDCVLVALGFLDLKDAVLVTRGSASMKTKTGHTAQTRARTLVSMATCVSHSRNQTTAEPSNSADKMPTNACGLTEDVKRGCASRNTRERHRKSPRHAAPGRARLP